MKRLQTKFHADTMSNSKVINPKKSKFIIRSSQNYLAAHFFLYLCFKATTTDMDLQV